MAATTLECVTARSRAPSTEATPKASYRPQEGDLVELLPHEVVFEFVPGRDMHGHLGIHNISNQPVAFKLKTTSLETYRVRPTTGIVDGGATVYVKIVKRAEKKYEVAADCGRDRFLVQAVPLDWGSVQGLASSDKGGEHAAAMSFRNGMGAPTQLYVRVRVNRSQANTWPTNASEFERLAAEVELKLREAMVQEGPDRQAQILVQFGVLLLTKGQMSMQQFNVLKQTVAELADSKRLEDHYRSQRRGRSSSRSRSGSRSGRERSSSRSRSSSSGGSSLMRLPSVPLDLQAMQVPKAAVLPRDDSAGGRRHAAIVGAAAAPAAASTASSAPSSASRGESAASEASSQNTQAGKCAMMARWLGAEGQSAAASPAAGSARDSAYRGEDLAEPVPAAAPAAPATVPAVAVPPLALSGGAPAAAVAAAPAAAAAAAPEPVSMPVEVDEEEEDKADEAAILAAAAALRAEEVEAAAAAAAAAKAAQLQQQQQQAVESDNDTESESEDDDDDDVSSSSSDDDDDMFEEAAETLPSTTGTAGPSTTAKRDVVAPSNAANEGEEERDTVSEMVSSSGAATADVSPFDAAAAQAPCLVSHRMLSASRSASMCSSDPGSCLSTARDACAIGGGPLAALQQQQQQQQVQQPQEQQQMQPLEQAGQQQQQQQQQGGPQHPSQVQLRPVIERQGSGPVTNFRSFWEGKAKKSPVPAVPLHSWHHGYVDVAIAPSHPQHSAAACAAAAQGAAVHAEAAVGQVPEGVYWPSQEQLQERQRRLQQQQQQQGSSHPDSARSDASAASFASDISTRSSRWARIRSGLFRK